MDLTTLRGPVAVVAIALDGPEGIGSVRQTVDVIANLHALAMTSRGHLLVEDDDILVVFSTAARAVDFAVLVHDAISDSVATGVHVGEVHPREDHLAGPAAHVARTLADHAQPGQTLLSRVVHDIVRGSPDIALAEIDALSEDLRLLAPVFLARPTSVATPARHASTAPPARLVDHLESMVSSARLTTIVAGAGTGKTRLARAVADLHPSVWVPVPPAGMRPAVFARALVDGLRIRVPGIPAMLTELAGGFEAHDADEQRTRAETLAATVAESLGGRLPRDLLLVVDGIDRLASWPVSLTLLEALARNSPSDLHLLLLGRRDPGLRTERLDAAGRLQAMGEEELRLSDDEVRDLVTAVLHPTPASNRVEDVADLADGHPETALLAAALVRHDDGPLPATPADVARAVLRHRPGPDRAVLEALAALGVATPILLAQVTGLSSIDTGPLLADGLVRSVAPGVDRVELGAAVGAVIEVAADDQRRQRVVAAAALRQAGDAAEALEVLRGTDAADMVLDILRDEGRALLAEGAWPAILDALDDRAIDPASWQGGQPVGANPGDAVIIGEAWRLAGDRDRALDWFHRASDALDRVPVWFAWRMGMLLHFGGELDQARALYARADVDGEPTDVALLRAWAAAAAWLQSDLAACRDGTADAMRLARISGDDGALAAAHTAQAMLAAVEGDRAGNDQHYLRALGYAERAGDVLQLMRIHTNRGSRLLEEGDHDEALAELELALRTADLSSALSLRGMALSNRGQVLRRLGRLDEATADLVASRAIFDRAGSRWVAYALANLGEIYDVRGERTQAILCHEEAIAQCEPVGDTQGTVPAHAGLARLLMSSDPERATQLAEMACSHPDSLGHAVALAAMAEVALSRGDVDLAATAVDQGLAVARQRRDRPGVATHLELRARLEEDPEAARQSLEEASDLWERMHCPLEHARVVVALAVADPTPEACESAHRAVQTLRSLGARAWADQAERLLAGLDMGAAPVMQVAMLGTPIVHVAGRPLPDRDLPSPDALRLLAYAITRSVVGRGGSGGPTVQAPWSDTVDRDRRLRAAGAELETFLAEHGCDGALSPTLVVDPSLLASDLGAFLSAADQGLDDYRNRRVLQAEERLAVAESWYGGELLAGCEPDPWLAVTRDDAAEVYLQVVMALVDLAERRDDSHGAVRLLLRVIERDPYDESAHLRLVACLERSGRRGESRRRYRTYTARMQEIGLEPAPFPDITPTFPGR